MKKQSNIMIIFLGIWFVAASINGILSGIIIETFEKKNTFFNSGIGLSFYFSYLFSIPFVGLILVIIAIVSQCECKIKLYKLIFISGLFSAILGGVFFIIAFGDSFSKTKYFIALSIVISALFSIFFFRKKIKNYE